MTRLQVMPIAGVALVSAAVGASLMHATIKAGETEDIRWLVGTAYEFLIYDHYNYPPGFHPPGLPPHMQPPSCFDVPPRPSELSERCDNKLVVINIGDSSSSGEPPQCDPLLVSPADIETANGAVHLQNTFYVAGKGHAQVVADYIER